VTSADLLEIDHAAEAFGVSKETLLRRLDGGGLPEAVRQNGNWSVPAGALSAIAKREGWPLDLTTDSPSRKLVTRPEKLHHYANETMAAHAAVVLAKTQATAARAEARDLNHQLTELTDELEAEMQARLQAMEALSVSEKAQAVLERDRAVADARADELRTQLEQERVERSLLASRVGVLEADREEAISSMGWWSRRRYDRSRNRSKGAAKPTWSNRMPAAGQQRPAQA
jgi:hypothetical protein